MAAPSIVVVPGSANPELAAAIARDADVPLARCAFERFADGEQHVELRSDVAGQDVFIVQPTGPPVGDNILELLLLADASRRSGAARVSALVPYVGYARADRRTQGGQALGARVMCDVLGVGPFERLVVMDLHTSALEAALPAPVVHTSAVPLLAQWLRTHGPPRAIVVSADLGAVKLAERYAHDLGLPTAIVHKKRVTGTEVSVRSVAGDVRGMHPILVDDMVSTAGTVEAAASALLERGCEPDITIVVTHGVLVGPALERLSALPIRRFVVTDTLRLPPLPFPHEIVSASPVLAEAIRRVHRAGTLSSVPDD